MIYLSHAYGGKKENRDHAKQIWLDLATKDITETYINPLESFGDLYDKVDYDTGIIMCLELMSKCSLVLITSPSDISEGVKIEINEAKRLGIPVEFYKKEN